MDTAPEDVIRAVVFLQRFVTEDAPARFFPCDVLQPPGSPKSFHQLSLGRHSRYRQSESPVAGSGTRLTTAPERV